MLKTAVKWFVILCVLSWAAHNQGQVAQGLHSLMTMGQGFISSLLSGVTSGIPAGGAAAGH